MNSPDNPPTAGAAASTARGLGRVAPDVVRCAVLAIVLAMTGAADAQEPEAPLPSFAELEAAGARIGEIRILNQDIFDTEDPKENNWLFRTANALHIQTRENVIETALLFKSGDRVSERLIDETERVLRAKHYLYDVRLRPFAYHDGVVDIEVAPRDTWTLELGISAARSGGTNSSGISLQELNLLGTGTEVGFDRSNTVDRSSNTFEIANDHAFDGWTLLSYSRARNSDGSSDAAAIIRPFYALDARCAAGANVSRDDRTDTIYD